MSAQAFASLEALFVPLQNASTLAAEQAKKVANLQLSSLESYVNLGFSQAKAAVALASPEEFQSFAGRQGEVLREMNDRAMSDLQQWVNLGTDFGSEIQKLFTAIARPSVN